MTREKNNRLRARTILICGTQGAICKKLGFGEGYYSDVINGWVRVSMKQKKRIAKALDCNVEDIF